MLTEEQKQNLINELKFSATRSSGPGGQNVNKVNTKVELRFSVFSSAVLSESQKEIIAIKLKNRINTEGELVLVAQSERSQWKNKEKATLKFFELLQKALAPVKKRIKTNPTNSSRLKRLDSKKITAQKKQLRKPPEF